MARAEFQRADGIVFEVAGDRAVLLNSVGLEMITLNPAGTTIWGHLDAPRSLDDLIERLQGEYPDVPTETLSTDVRHFLDEMLESVLVAHHAPD